MDQVLRKTTMNLGVVKKINKTGISSQWGTSLVADGTLG